MHNQHIEECLIYTFLPMSPTWNGLLGP